MDWLDFTSASITADPGGDLAVGLLNAELSVRAIAVQPRDRPSPQIELSLEPDRVAADESYRVVVSREQQGPRARVAARSPRGLCFGVGRLLREARFERGRFELPDALDVAGQPRFTIRGHQLGYRPLNNTLDAWDPADFERYLRELLVFGCNAVEFVAPRSDDADDGPHLRLPTDRMLVELSRVSNRLDLDTWVWQPLLRCDVNDDRSLDAAVDAVAGKLLPLDRLDAVFIPSADPGRLPPARLLHAVKRMHQALSPSHPSCQVWVSAQEMDEADLRELSRLLQRGPTGLFGLVYGPWTHVPLSAFRSLMPKRYPIRGYPDITHTRECQFPVPRWDWPFAFTQGREMINPRPRAMSRLVEHHASDTCGFITYSEGVHDDLNKFVWSGLAWEGATLRDVLLDYGNYFLDRDLAEPFATIVEELEKQWEEPVAGNPRIVATLSRLLQMKRSVSPRVRRNWRFQLAEYRARFDADVQSRLAREQDAERTARTILADATRLGAIPAMDEAARRLNEPGHRPIDENRIEIIALADSLYQSIGLQSSVERHGASAILRGGHLDEIDAPLNDRLFLLSEFAAIRQVPEESARLAAIERLLHRDDPGPGGFLDRLGDRSSHPHLVFPRRDDEDPSQHVNPALEVGLVPSPEGLCSLPVAMLRGWHRPIPLAWCGNASSLHGQPLVLRYDRLDPSRRYRVRVVYAEDQRAGPIRLTTHTGAVVHDWLDLRSQSLEFDLPEDAAADGTLELRFEPRRDPHVGITRVQVAELLLFPVSQVRRTP